MFPGDRASAWSFGRTRSADAEPFDGAQGLVDRGRHQLLRDGPLEHPHDGLHPRVDHLAAEPALDQVLADFAQQAGPEGVHRPLAKARVQRCQRAFDVGHGRLRVGVVDVAVRQVGLDQRVDRACRPLLGARQLHGPAFFVGRAHRVVVGLGDRLARARWPVAPATQVVDEEASRALVVAELRKLLPCGHASSSSARRILLASVDPVSSLTGFALGRALRLGGRIRAFARAARS